MNNSKWNIQNISDQSGRIAIVTGASSGIGFETARVLAEKKAIVIIAVRNPEKGSQAIKKIRLTHPDADVTMMLLDLTDLSSVDHFSKAFKQDYTRLDLLINNAGVMIPPYQLTKDGFELQMGTNHLGHFALTGLLLDLLKQTPDSRIVNVSSMAHKMGHIDLKDLAWEKRKYRKWDAYGDSKLANLYFTFELHRRISANGNNPIVTAAHPGWTATDLQRYTSLINFLNHFFAQKISMGALPTLRAALDPDVTGGEFFGPDGFFEIKGHPRLVSASRRAQDPDTANFLWDKSIELAGVHPL